VEDLLSLMALLGEDNGAENSRKERVGRTQALKAKVALAELAQWFEDQ
jgi:hypothetical protein